MDGYSNDFYYSYNCYSNRPEYSLEYNQNGYSNGLESYFRIFYGDLEHYKKYSYHCCNCDSDLPYHCLEYNKNCCDYRYEYDIYGRFYGLEYDKNCDNNDYYSDSDFYFDCI